MKEIKLSELIEIKAGIIEKQKLNNGVRNNNRVLRTLLEARKKELQRTQKMLRSLILKSLVFRIRQVIALININAAIKLSIVITNLKEFKKAHE